MSAALRSLTQFVLDVRFPSLLSALFRFLLTPLPFVDPRRRKTANARLRLWNRSISLYSAPAVLPFSSCSYS